MKKKRYTRVDLENNTFIIIIPKRKWGTLTDLNLLREEFCKQSLSSMFIHFSLKSNKVRFYQKTYPIYTFNLQNDDDEIQKNKILYHITLYSKSYVNKNLFLYVKCCIISIFFTRALLYILFFFPTPSFSVVALFSLLYQMYTVYTYNNSFSLTFSKKCC